MQEQHPDRARLYADWQGLDFPILWDPFNTTGVEGILINSFIDEHGIVRATGLDPRDGEGLRDHVRRVWPKEAPPVPAAFVTPAMGRVRIAHRPGSLQDAKAAMSRFLWAPSKAESAYDGLVRSLEKRLASDDVTPADHFRAGVARRLRFDSGFGEPGDVQASIDHWVEALRMNPNQYIWRRRIQQWGPRLDKPYPFYDWVDEAFSDLAERGTPHPPLLAPLTGSEIAGRGEDPALEALTTEPDPEAKITLDEGELVRVEIAIAPSSDASKKGVRIHVSLIPSEGTHWTPEADAPQIWIVAGIGDARQSYLLDVALPEGKAPIAPATLDFEWPTALDTPSLEGYALYSICTEDVCLYRRQNL